MCSSDLVPELDDGDEDEGDDADEVPDTPDVHLDLGEDRDDDDDGGIPIF